MGLFQRRPKYEDPVESETVERPEQRPDDASRSAKERRRLAKLRKKAAGAARKADREAEKARQAAQKVREAAPTPSGQRDEVEERQEDVPDDLAGKDRAQVLSKREARKLKRLRRKAQKG